MWQYVVLPGLVFVGFFLLPSENYENGDYGKGEGKGKGDYYSDGKGYGKGEHFSYCPGCGASYYDDCMCYRFANTGKGKGSGKSGKGGNNYRTGKGPCPLCRSIIEMSNIEKSNIEITCPICIQDFSPGTNMSKLYPCGHHLCPDCWRVLENRFLIQ